MKRSAWVSLALMSSSPFLLAACDDSAPKQIPFATVQQCEAQGNSPAECQAAQSAAQANAAQQPTFSALDQCVARYGPNGCTVQHDSGGNSVFGPLVTGFLIGHLLSNGTRSYAAPVYRSGYSPGYSSGYNGSAAYRAAPVSVTSPSTYSGSTSSRGSFGSASAARGSWGG